MNHVSDIAWKVEKLLRTDPAVFMAEVYQDEPRTDTDWYPNRDGEWFVKLCMRDGRLYRLRLETGEEIYGSQDS